MHSSHSARYRLSSASTLHGKDGLPSCEFSVRVSVSVQVFVLLFIFALTHMRTFLSRLLSTSEHHGAEHGGNCTHVYIKVTIKRKRFSSLRVCSSFFPFSFSFFLLSLPFSHTHTYTPGCLLSCVTDITTARAWRVRMNTLPVQEWYGPLWRIYEQMHDIILCLL